GTSQRDVERSAYARGGRRRLRPRVAKKGRVVMARSPKSSSKSAAIEATAEPSAAVLRAPAEGRYKGGIERLLGASDAPRPAAWPMSARAARRFILGDEKLAVSRKFYGDDPLVDRAVVTLIGAQGLMLVGEPGTAKSMLSELLAAAISGNSG